MGEREGKEKNRGNWKVNRSNLYLRQEWNCNGTSLLHILVFITWSTERAKRFQHWDLIVPTTSPTTTSSTTMTTSSTDARWQRLRLFPRPANDLRSDQSIFLKLEKRIKINKKIFSRGLPNFFFLNFVKKKIQMHKNRSETTCFANSFNNFKGWEVLEVIFCYTEKSPYELSSFSNNCEIMYTCWINGTKLEKASGIRRKAWALFWASQALASNRAFFGLVIEQQS